MGISDMILRKKQFDLSMHFIYSSLGLKEGGSSAYYSRILHPFVGWSKAYPETTGYLIPTLLKIYELGNREDDDLLISIDRQVEWLASIQSEDGWFPAGLYPNTDRRGSIFNTAQIIIGLLCYYDYSGEERYLHSAVRAANWLANSQNDQGTWDQYNYKTDYFPSYYTRVSWPILLVGEKTSSSTLIESATKVFERVLDKVEPNGFIRDMGFDVNSKSFLHTVAYTIRGFIEGYRISRDDRYWKSAYDLAYALLRKYEISGRLPGAFATLKKSESWYRCLTGEAQLCIVWMTIYTLNEDIRFLSASSKLLDSLSHSQTRNSIFFKRGGLMGSQPFFGRYMALRQPNWAVKFFLDAIILESDLYNQLK